MTVGQLRGRAAIDRSGEDNARTAFWWTFAGVFVVWNLATVLGAAGTSALGDPTTFGLDAVVPAAFLALLAPRLRQGRLERGIAVTGAVIAFALIPITPPGVPVLAAAVAVLLAVTVRTPEPSNAPAPESGVPA